MGGKSKAPKPPDYGPIAAASREAAQMSYQLGREQLAWAKEQYAKDSQITGRVVDQFLKDMDTNSATARKDRERYERIFQPLEESLATEAATYDTPERRAAEAGRASAAVAQQYNAQRQQAQSELESYGINPADTRYAALDVGIRSAQAAAQAAGANEAERYVENRGDVLRSEAINVGRGYPGQVAQQYGVAGAAGSGAGGQTLATTASGASTMGTAPQYMGLGNQAVGTWGNTVSQGYRDSLEAWKANASNSSGIGGLLGGVLGVAMGFDDGGPVPGALPVQPVASQGGGVPVAASPSRGAAIDDVPARLTPGEFVVPKDIVAWKGEEFFQKMIQKSREARKEGSNARPDVRTAIPGAPRFQSQGIPA
jgi:hypothetical protein